MLTRPLAVISAHACPFSEIGGAENGGMSVYIREVTSRLAERGVRSVIYTRKEDAAAPAHVDLPAGCQLVHVQAGPPQPLDKDALFYHMPEFFRGVVRHARENELGFELVQSHYWLSAWAGRRLGRLWGVPWVHMAHTQARIKDRDRPPGAAREADHRIAVELETVRNCNRLVASTAAEVEDLAFLYGAERDCVSVVPPGVDLELFHAVDATQLRSALGLAGGDQVVLFTGRLERLKGVETLVRAVAAMIDGNPDRRLRLLVLGEDSGNGVHESAGYGGERGRLEALAAELGVSDRVFFLGKVAHDELPAYYSLADVCAVPSYSESFGLVALEAQACGTPVVASRVGGLRQIVLDGITGYTIPEHDPPAYAAALTRVLDDDALRRTLGAAGRRLAESYSWESTADRLLAVYQDTRAYYDRTAESLLG